MRQVIMSYKPIKRFSTFHYLQCMPFEKFKIMNLITTISEGLFSTLSFPIQFEFFDLDEHNLFRYIHCELNVLI